MSTALAILEAETPKGVFKKVVSPDIEPFLKQHGFELAADVPGAPSSKSYVRGTTTGYWSVRVTEKPNTASCYWTIWRVDTSRGEGPTNWVDPKFQISGEGAGTLSRAITSLPLDEAEDPKSVFKKVTTVPQPPRDLLQNVMAKRSKYLRQQCNSTSIATNPHGETFCYGWFGSGPRKDQTVSTLLVFDKRQMAWQVAYGATGHDFQEPHRQQLEAEDPKSFLKGKSKDADENVRDLLRRAKCTPEGDASGRYERWYRPSLIDKRQTDEFIRFAHRDVYGWEFNRWHGNQVVWHTDLMTADKMKFFIQRHYFHPHTGQPFPQVNEAEETPKSVFKAATGAALPTIERGKEVSGRLLRRLCSQYPVNGIYIWKQPGQFPRAEGVLQINFKHYGLVRQDWASFGCLAGALMRWRNLDGARLWIDGVAQAPVSSTHPALAQIDRGTDAAPVAEAEDPKQFFKRMSQQAEQGEVKFGFAINTGDEYMMTENARELGIDLDQAAWEILNRDSWHLEANCIRILRKLGIDCRAEGHSGDNELIGTAWATPGTPGFETLKRWVETDGESLRYENLVDCFPGAGALLWTNVSEMSQRIAMVRIDFFDYQDIQGLTEARKPTAPKPPLGENPKDFFRRMISTGKLGTKKDLAYRQVLEYMPKDFVQAYQQKRHAEWRQDDLSWTDRWPEYDDDDDRDGGNPWSESVYYFNYETDEGKIDVLVMRCDMDGNHDIQDAAEVGTPEAEQLEKDYGSDGWHQAMHRYWEWVRDRHEDPLHYIMDERIEVKREWIVSFVKDQGRLRLAQVRQLTEKKPSPPAVSFEQAKAKAQTDEAWKELLDYCLVDENGFTEATEEECVKEGGQWDKKGRLILRPTFTSKERTQKSEEQIAAIAQDAIDELDRPRP